MRSVNVLMVGDISGEAGMGALFLSLSSLVKKTGADFVVVNGENASGGFGLTVDDYMKIRSYGADVVTSGNHIWQKSEILPQLEGDSVLLRPLNYPRGVPGHGVCTVTKNGVRYAVINAQGRTDLVIADDPQFKRKDNDLYADVHIDLYTAVLGGETTIHTLDGQVKLKVRPGTQNGDKARLKGKGFPVYKQEGSFGDLIITYQVTLPTQLTEKQKELFRQLQAAS